MSIPKPDFSRTSPERNQAGSIFFGAILLSALLSAPSVHAEQELIEITHAVWTDGVNRATREYAREYQEQAPAGSLYLWMRIKAHQGALDRLASEGKLPIRHQWYRESLLGVLPEGSAETEMIDDIAIPAARKSLAHSLQSEINQRGFFDWRTWSVKQKIKRGTWQVRVVYADYSPVLCGEEHKPCEYLINVE